MSCPDLIFRLWFGHLLKNKYY